MGSTGPFPLNELSEEATSKGGQMLLIIDQKKAFGRTLRDASPTFDTLLGEGDIDGFLNHLIDF